MEKQATCYMEDLQLPVEVAAATAAALTTTKSKPDNKLTFSGFHPRIFFLSLLQLALFSASLKLSFFLSLLLFVASSFLSVCFPLYFIIICVHCAQVHEHDASRRNVCMLWSELVHCGYCGQYSKPKKGCCGC